MVYHRPSLEMQGERGVEYNYVNQKKEVVAGVAGAGRGSQVAPGYGVSSLEAAMRMPPSRSLSLYTSALPESR